MAVKKRILTLALIVNLVTCSLATQFIQDDILAFPRYKVVLTNEKIPNSQINHKDVEVKERNKHALSLRWKKITFHIAFLSSLFFFF
jgi:hypothetical protein